MARELDYLACEGSALSGLAIAAWYNGDNDDAVQLIRQAQLIAGMPRWQVLGSINVMIDALIAAGDLGTAESACDESGSAPWSPTTSRSTRMTSRCSTRSVAFRTASA